MKAHFWKCERKLKTNFMLDDSDKNDDLNWNELENNMTMMISSDWHNHNDADNDDDDYDDGNHVDDFD